LSKTVFFIYLSDDHLGIVNEPIDMKLSSEMFAFRQLLFYGVDPNAANVATGMFTFASLVKRDDASNIDLSLLNVNIICSVQYGI